MSYEVWAWNIDYSPRLKPIINENVIRLAPGHIKTVQHEVPRTGYDGTGQSRDDRKGYLTFVVPVKRKNYAGNEQFKEIFRFLQAHKEAGNKSFYYYNPAEKLTPDLTGVDDTGRYIVKCVEPWDVIWTRLTLWDFADLTFEEVHS